MQIQGSTFLISGGSSGLGAACVRTLARSGARVVLADLNSAAGEAVAAEFGPEVHFVQMA
jgi:NAD(P)-dependent dehydrogenase (short-subunit alcohol dehydrogenase family)